VNSYNQIIKSGKVSRGAIGIQFAREDNPSLLKVYGASNGVFVSQVTPNGPAAKAGVQVSDVILAVNGRNITTGEQLVEMISAAQPGSTVDLKVLRDGKTMTVPVKIGDRAAIVAENGEQGAPEASEEGEGPTTHARLGVSVQNLSQADREQMGLKATGGVVIASVEPGSFAEDIGLQKGDVLLEINRHHVTSGADVRNIMQSAKPGEAMAFKVMRGDGNGNWQSLFAAGTVPAASQQ